MDQVPSHFKSKVKEHRDKKRMFYTCIHCIPCAPIHLSRPQPLDVIINKPLKWKVRGYYHYWLENNIKKIPKELYPLTFWMKRIKN